MGTYISGVNINLYILYGGLSAMATKIINACTLSVRNAINENLFYKETCNLEKVIHWSIVDNTKDEEKTNKCPWLLCNLVINNEVTNNKERFLTSVIRWKSSMQNNKYNMTFLVEKEGG